MQKFDDNATVTGIQLLIKVLNEIHLTHKQTHTHINTNQANIFKAREIRVQLGTTANRQPPTGMLVGMSKQ